MNEYTRVFTQSVKQVRTLVRTTVRNVFEYTESKVEEMKMKRIGEKRKDWE